MTRSLLAGGTALPRSFSFQAWLVSTWLPVVVMLTAIAIESTHAFSSDNTSGWMRAVFQLFAGRVTDRTWLEAHHIIRKTGHFTGYGLLGLAWMRAWLIFWWQPLKRSSRRRWRSLCFIMAIVCTMLVASLDELHQSFMKDRTGLVSDVLLDTAGAFFMVAIFSVIERLRKGDTSVTG